MNLINNIILSTNKHYINNWNLFSKSILLKNNNDKYLFIVDNEKRKEEYKKIFNFLNIFYIEVNNFSSLIDLIYNRNKLIYIIEKSFFESDINNLREIENRKSIHIKKWNSINIEEFLWKLNDFWYKYWEFLEEWNYNKHWDLISVKINNYIEYKISLWWENIEEIIKIENNENTQIDSFSIWKIESIIIKENNSNFNNELLKKIDTNWNKIILDNLDFYINYQEFLKLDNKIVFNNLKDETVKQIDLNINDLYIEKIEELTELLKGTEYTNKIIYTKNKKTIKNYIDYNNISNITINETKLNNLKSFKTHNTIVLCDDNISRVFIKKRIKRSLSKSMDLLLQIKPWDYIVHIDHWIWIFKEIVEKELSWIKKEYIELEYKNNDKLYIPITEIYRVSKYVWTENPKLTWLNTKEWDKKIKNASEDIQKIANELLEIYAKRKLQKWFQFKKYKEEEIKFQQSFQYTYTDDQIKVIREIFDDMESEITMDRLLSWDVWFWKTEIAFNAIFKAVMNWKQAALISPLVVLAYEHYEKAIDRFKDFWIIVEVLTRFEKASAIKNTLEKLKNWKIDLIIWTHRLLSEDVEYKDLWLLVVDEEHKFWVKDKEKIKNLKWNIDILSMSATPIPRSLNMALSWIRSMSMLTTPPFWRKNIHTYVSRFDNNIILQAWKKEFERWGQLFFIHNRVSTINSMKKHLEELFPNKSVIITHWQLPWDQLEKRIIQFKRKEYDILLSTTVIENWIDFSNVNTIFINEAYNFWISQIHQLRWRVWRNDKQWYCYLLYRKDKIKEDAAKRLKTIVDYSHLWAWFELAIKDLEIRWWWDILGINQSGQSQNIWINLFLEMLENKVEELKNKIDNKEEKENIYIPTIDLNISAYISENYFSSELDKINFYREIESLNNIEDLNNIIEDFNNMNPDFSIETQNFFDLLKIKILSIKYKIKSIKKIWINYQIDFLENIKIEELKKFLVLDYNINFTVITWTRLRSETKRYNSDYNFVKYLLDIFENKKQIKKKIKLKR